MDELYCYAYVEDEPSSAVVRRLVHFRNLVPGARSKLVLRTGFPASMGGFGKIKSKMPAICATAATGLCVLVLTDLDTASCAPSLIVDWVPQNKTVNQLPQRLWFRVAVREVESWLIADRIALSKFLGVAPKNFPTTPDSLQDPKQYLLNVIRAKCKARKYRDMLPEGNAYIGISYNRMLVKFVDKFWDPNRAVDFSVSLKRAMDSLIAIE